MRPAMPLMRKMSGLGLAPNEGQGTAVKRKLQMGNPETFREMVSFSCTLFRVRADLSETIDKEIACLT